MYVTIIRWSYAIDHTKLRYIKYVALILTFVSWTIVIYIAYNSNGGSCIALCYVHRCMIGCTSFVMLNYGFFSLLNWKATLARITSFKWNEFQDCTHFFSFKLLFSLFMDKCSHTLRQNKARFNDYETNFEPNLNGLFNFKLISWMFCVILVISFSIFPDISSCFFAFRFKEHHKNTSFSHVARENKQVSFYKFRYFCIDNVFELIVNHF